MSLRDSFFAAAGATRREQHVLPDGTVLYVGEVGADEWLEIEDETQDYRARNNTSRDPLIDARLVVRSVVDAENQYVFKRFTPTGDPDKDKAGLEAYEAELWKIIKTPRRVGIPLLRAVNRVNFAGDAAVADLKKKSASETSAGSCSSAATPAS